MDDGHAVQFLQRFQQTKTNLACTSYRIDTARCSEFKEYGQTNESMGGKQLGGVHVGTDVSFGKDRGGEDGTERYGCPWCY